VNKTMIGLIVLAALCLGLGVAVLVTRKQAADEKKKDTDTIANLSNKWVDTSSKLEEQKQVGLALEQDVTLRKQLFSELTNKFSELTNKFSSLTNR